MTDLPKPDASQQPGNDTQPLELVTNPYHVAADQPSLSSSLDAIPLSALPKLITSDELFGDERQILIDHAGAVYRLQITKQGKLILTK